MKIYIAGPMTGLLLYNRPAFNRKACELISKGYTPIHTAGMPLGLEYEVYMEESFKRLKECEAVLLLEDWDLSPGVMREIYFAHQNGIRITESLEKIDEWGKQGNDKQ